MAERVYTVVVHKAIELMLETLTEEGKPIPADTDPIETVSTVSVPA